MFRRNVVLLVIAMFDACMAGLVLVKGKEETITFTGSELQIEVDNSGGANGQFTMCISSSTTNTGNCPEGYEPWKVPFESLKQTFTMNRQGRITTTLLGQEVSWTLHSIRLKDDEILDVMLYEVPGASTKVTLLNAERYVPPESDTTTEKSSNSAAIGITIGVVVGVLVVVIIVAAAVGTFIYCKKKKKKAQKVPPPVVSVKKTPGKAKSQTGGKTEATTQKTPIPEPTPTPTLTLSQPPSQSSNPSVKPTPSAEKPLTPSVEKPRTPSAEKPKTPSAETNPPKSAESTPAPPEASTPKSTDVPAIKPIKWQERVLYHEIYSESILDYGLRHQRLGETEEMMISQRYRSRPHDVSALEKAVLKKTKPFVVDNADKLIEHLKKELDDYGFDPKLGLYQPDVLWQHIDDVHTMTSLFYYLMLLIRPKLFKVSEENINCDDVAKMPVSMIYCLILNQKLKRSFREELVKELRVVSYRIILTGEYMADAAFPLHYQSRFRFKKADDQSGASSKSSATRSNV